MQSRKGSAVEAIVNTVVGFAVAWLVWETVIVTMLQIPHSGGQGFLVTMIFTIVSLIRSYVLRRLFNWWGHRT